MKDDTPNIFKHPDDGCYDIPTSVEFNESVFPEPYADFKDDSKLCYCNVPTSQDDAVNQPAHYTQRSMECIDWIRVALEGLEGEEAFCIGAALKYIWRSNYKNGAEDLEKAIWYLKRNLKQKWGRE